MIRSFLYLPDVGVKLHEGIGDFDSWCEQDNALLWIDMCKPTDEESFVLTNDFQFHPLAIEDVIAEKPRTKIDDYDRYLFLVFQAVDYVGRQEGLKLSEIDLFLSGNSLVTVHYDEHRIFDYLYARTERDERLMMRGIDFLFHAVIDTIVDNYNSTLDILEYEIDQVEEDVLAEPDQDTVKSIFTLRRDILQLKRTVLPQKEVISQLSRQHYKLVSEKAALYFSDIHDHLVRISDVADSHRETLNSSLEVYYSSVSTKTNQIIKVLTMFTVLFIPPTFLVGLWGMNFEFMPEHEWKYGYYMSLVLMAAIVLGLIVFFRKKKWL
ncbi:MAG: magnesium/cobalt transporter CorA [candidate division Zixibacteria bacterium]|nr:magnesium/cobalt transporter CorA [candidate division Zixibacteria bacterium]MDH3937887.1 magnesium/cobalt transporter CorA [candidate division Zixibacteria bacterium]MDH4035288.1 magnesium/cobalt transporter CorA [candidate division Zixibacteria bacterium]